MTTRIFMAHKRVMLVIATASIWQGRRVTKVAGHVDRAAVLPHSQS